MSVLSSLSSFSSLTVATASPSDLDRPGRLRQSDLLRTTDIYADAVLRGQYRHLLPATGLPADQRWFTRLHSDDALDVWLISWVPEHATELHDHAESLGALTVVSGSLDEFHWDRGRLRRRRLAAGDQAAFNRGWVHDVVWAPPSRPVAGLESVPPAGPTLSVHAYSPPLTRMSYYDVDEATGALRHRRTEVTDLPEAS